MKQSGKAYFKDYYNRFDLSMFIIFTAYFGLRMYNPIAMLVGTLDES